MLRTTIQMNRQSRGGYPARAGAEKTGPIISLSFFL